MTPCAKLTTLPLLAGRNIDASFVVPTVATSIDLVVHAELDRTGHRHVVEIVAPTGRAVDGRDRVDAAVRATARRTRRDG